MGDALTDGLSDAGSNPARSIKTMVKKKRKHVKNGMFTFFLYGHLSGRHDLINGDIRGYHDQQPGPLFAGPGLFALSGTGKTLFRECILKK